jgi:hypothetical protein
VSLHVSLIQCCFSKIPTRPLRVKLEADWFQAGIVNAQECKTVGRILISGHQHMPPPAAALCTLASGFYRMSKCVHTCGCTACYSVKASDALLGRRVGAHKAPGSGQLGTLCIIRWWCRSTPQRLLTRTSVSAVVRICMWSDARVLGMGSATEMCVPVS